MNDRELIELLRTDPERGLAAVIDKYSGYVYKIAYSKLSAVCRREDIEEAVSDIFLSFYNYAVNAENALPAVSPYLGVIAKRHSINIYKKQLARSDDISFEEIADTIADGTEERDMRREQLVSAILSLGKPDSEIFMRKYFFGQKSREIAADLDMKTNTVDKTISRGLVRLRKILAEREGI